MPQSIMTIQGCDVMKIMQLYRYIRSDGGVSVSPSIPDCEYTEMFRLIAEEGKILTQNGIDTTPCVDVEVTDGWYEIDEPVGFDVRTTPDVLGVDV